MQWKTRTFKSGQADAIDLARSTMICYAYCQAGFEYLWKPATEEVYAKSLQNLIFATLASVATSANCHWWRQLTLKKELSANKKSAGLTLADDFAMQMLRHFCVSHFTNLGIGCSNIVSPWIWSKPTLLENEEQKKWAWVAQWAMPTRQRRKERSSNVRSCAHCKCWQRNERSTDVTLAC